MIILHTQIMFLYNTVLKGRWPYSECNTSLHSHTWGGSHDSVNEHPCTHVALLKWMLSSPCSLLCVPSFLHPPLCTRHHCDKRWILFQPLECLSPNNALWEVSLFWVLYEWNHTVVHSARYYGLKCHLSRYVELRSFIFIAPLCPRA